MSMPRSPSSDPPVLVRVPAAGAINEPLVRQTILGLLELPPQPDGSPVSDDTLLSDLARDSFALLELCFRLQEELPVLLEQSDLATVRTLGDLIRLVTARARGR
jgi:acyl carrier protein